MGRCRSFPAVIMVVIVAILMAEETGAQEADCASKLVPCAGYLNSTKPPESCCKPLRETVQKQRDCLCNLYENPSLLKSIGVNITQALELPKYCGVSSDTSACKKGTATPPTVAVPPPGVTGSNGNGANGASKIAWMGISSLLLFWASIMA